jgi:hypothetical protein
VPASCGTLPSLSRLGLATSHLFNLLVLVGGYLDRAYLLPVPESHCPPKDYSSALPPAMRRCTRTSNCLERLNAKVKRRAKVIGVFPSEGSLIRLVGTYLIEENDRWAAKSKQYYLPAVEEL